MRLLEPTTGTFTDNADAGRLLGFGFVVGLGSKAAHRCVLKRVMTCTDHRGRNLGQFYRRFGYVETGRVPGGLRFSFGDRDDVDVACRLDRRPLC